MAFPSTFVQTQDAVIRRLRIDDTSANRTRVKDWINQAYAYVVTQTECLQKRATAPLTANTAIYTLPSAIVRIKYVAIKGSGQSEYGPPLQEVTVDDLLEWRKSSGGVSAATGTPTHYCLVGLYEYELWPPPQSADTILFYYVYLPTALSGDTDVAVLQEPWNTKLLEYGALVEASNDMRVPNEDTYRQWFELWMGRFQQHLNRRGGGNTRQLELLRPRVYVPHDPSVDLGYDWN